jgi:hypothetical protein
VASSVSISNSILWFNVGGVGGVTQDQQVQSPNATLLLQDSMVEGWTGSVFSTGGAQAFGVLGVYPQFIDIDGADNIMGSDDDNYRLAPTSPARDSGWDASAPAASHPVDLDKQPRIVDDPVWANRGFQLSRIDRGCYEAQTPGAPCNPADVAATGQLIGADGALTADDIIVFVNWFFAGDARADLAGSGQVPVPDGAFSADDLIVFINRFFAGC